MASICKNMHLNAAKVNQVGSVSDTQQCHRNDAGKLRRVTGFLGLFRRYKD